MSARSLVLATCGALALLAAHASAARAEWYPDRGSYYHGGYYREEWRERARLEHEARERAWREREWHLRHWRYEHGGW